MTDSVIIYRSQVEQATDQFLMSGAWIPFVTSLAAAGIVFYVLITAAQGLAGRQYIRYDRLFNTVAGIVAGIVFFTVYSWMP